MDLWSSRNNFDQSEAESLIVTFEVGPPQDEHYSLMMT